MTAPTVEPMTPKVLRRLMRKPAVERYLGDPGPGERLLLRFVRERERLRGLRPA